MRRLRTRRQLLRAISCGSAMVLLAGCQTATSPSAPAGAPAPTAAPQAITLPTLKAAFTEITENRLPLWLGVDQGVFDRYGVHVDSTWIASTPTAIAALLSGDVQLIEAAAGVFIGAVQSGAPLVAIGTVASATGYQLYVKPEIKTPQDLVGKKVAVSKLGSNSYNWIKSMLTAMGVADQVALVPNGDLNSNYAAFLSDAVQGFATTPVNRIGEPDNAHPLGDPVALGVDSPGHFFVVRTDVLRANRATLVDFLTGYEAATQMSYTDDALATQVLGNHLQKTDPTYLRGVIDSYVHVPGATGGMPLDCTPTVELMRSQIALQAQADALIDPSKLDAAAFLDATLMEDVKASPAWRYIWPTGVPV